MNTYCTEAPSASCPDASNSGVSDGMLAFAEGSCESIWGAVSAVAVNSRNGGT